MKENMKKYRGRKKMRRRKRTQNIMRSERKGLKIEINNQGIE